MITRAAPAWNLFAERLEVQIGHCFGLIENVVVEAGAVNIPDPQIGATIFLLAKDPIVLFLKGNKLHFWLAINGDGTLRRSF